jgi:hypothetical protein
MLYDKIPNHFKIDNKKIENKIKIDISKKKLETDEEIIENEINKNTKTWNFFGILKNYWGNKNINENMGTQLNTNNIENNNNENKIDNNNNNLMNSNNNNNNNNNLINNNNNNNNNYNLLNNNNNNNNNNLINNNNNNNLNNNNKNNDKILINILKYLNIKELLIISLLSKNFKLSILSNSNIIWESLFINNKKFDTFKNFNNIDMNNQAFKNKNEKFILKKEVNDDYYKKLIIFLNKNKLLDINDDKNYFLEKDSNIFKKITINVSSNNNNIKINGKCVSKNIVF